MTWIAGLPAPDPAAGNRLLVVEAPLNLVTERALRAWLQESQSGGAKGWLLPCSFERGGVWAGMREFLHDLVATAGTGHGDLLERHAAELHLVLPTLRDRLTVRHRTLTDTASSGEKVRNYPRDRAYRIVQGLIEFAAEVISRSGWTRPLVVCERFSEAGELGRLFFTDLLRRRGAQLDLTLVACNAVGATTADDIKAAAGRLFRPDIQVDLPEAGPSAMSAAARQLEASLADDGPRREESLPELVYYWSRSETPEVARKWRAFAFAYCHHHGLYQAALAYATDVLEHLEAILEENTFFLRWDIVGTICDDYLATGQPERALELVQTEGLDKIDDLKDRVKIYYAMAMINARFLSKPDFPAAEGYIEKALETLARADVDDKERAFLRVFTLNGLAFVRHRQGRPDEAIALCRAGYDLLQEKLTSDEHRLHRSVLLYNIGQVYAWLRRFEEAVQYYSSAIEFDPHYSEYYNERGNLYLNLGRFDEALADYRRAISMSAPYQEVWTNVGQCHKLKGDLPAAVEAYTHALDLEPQQLLPRLGRAQTLARLGHKDEAITDYTQALAVQPHHPEALSNRATLLHADGRFHASLQDLDAAIALAPGNSKLYLNRSIVLADLGLQDKARSDLGRCLDLSHDDRERASASARLRQLSEARDCPPGDALLNAPHEA